MTTTIPFSSRLGGLNTWARTLALGLATTLGAAPLAAQAQLVLDSATPKTETFDNLGTSATATVPTGFKLSAEAAPTYASANNYTATTVAANGNNFTAGGTYNFAATAGSSDRALGFLNSGSYTTPRHILLAVSNTSGSTVQDLTVQFSLEKYRSGSREYNWTFWTSPDGVTWTAQAAGAQNYPADATNTVYSYPPLTTTKTVALTGLNLASGATTYLRWTQQGVSGSTNGQAAGLDDVTLTPTLGGATTPAPAPATIATGSVSPTSFCVTSAAGSAAFDVPFTTTGTLGAPYSVQLSDASGQFANTTSGIIGSGSSSPIAASIPAGTASGSGYRVRVLSGSPATAGTDNGQDLTVSLTAASNPVTLTPGAAQSVTTTGTGTALTAAAALAGSTYTFQYGTSATGPFTALGSAAGASYTVLGTDFPGAGTYYVVAQATATTSCGSVVGTSDPVTVTVTAPATQPALSVSDAALADFGSVAAGAGSLLKDFTVEGTGLTGPLTITPPAGFEIRLEGGAFACCPIVLTPSGGAIILTTIEVRFVPTAAQAYAASITVAGGGQPTQAVAVAGTGIDAVYPATLGTVALTAITGSGATTGGTIATDGGSPVATRGVVWSKTANPTVLLTTKTADGSGAGTFASTITGLVPGTTYYVRAYATNGAGTTYGNELTFSTVAVALAAEPAAPATIVQGTLGGTSVQLLLGGGPSQKRLVLARLGSTAPDALPADATTYTANAAFGSGQAIAASTYVVYAGTGSDVTVTGLRPGTAYSFTVYAFNDNDTPYAENYLTASPGTLGVTTPAAPAALLLEENFDYPAGALLSANNWTAHSGAGTNPIAVVAGSLSQAGYGPNSGNAAALTGNGEDVNRQFAPVYARTPTYAAFLVKVNSASTTADYFFHLGPQPIGTTFRARVFVRRTASGKVQFGTSSGTGTASYASTEYELGSTNLLVVKYTFDEASNSSSLFINPAASTEPATPDATATETGTTPAAPNNNIGAVALRQGTNSPNLVVDGLRVGTSFEVVKTGLAAPALAAVTVLYANGGTSATDGTIDPFLQLVNNSGAAIPYQELTVRYYLTVENFSPIQATIGYAELGTSGVQARYVALPQPAQGALGYLEYSFTSAKALGAGANSGAISSHANKQNYSAFNEADDYSYAPNPVYAPNDHITVYRNGTLVSGTEPAPMTATVQLQAQSANQTTEAIRNTIDVVTQVNNLSTVAVPYQDLTVRYWFTPDGTSLLQGGVGYAQVGTSAVSLTSGQVGTQSYVELHFDASLGSLAPLGNSGLLIFHLNKENYGNFNQADDYSFRNDMALAENPHVTVYQQGTLVYGQEPAAAQGKATTQAALRMAAPNSALTQGSVFEAFPNPFTEQAALHFRPATNGPAKLVVYNTLGQVVKTYFDGPAQAGQDYGFVLEGSGLSAGAYLARLQADGKTQTVRLMLAK